MIDIGLEELAAASGLSHRLDVLCAYKLSDRPFCAVYRLEAPPEPSLVLKVFRDADFGPGLNEAIFFNDLAPLMNRPPIPRCCDVHVDFERHYCHLLFEDLTPAFVSPRRLLRPAEYVPIVDALASFHAEWRDHEILESNELAAPDESDLRMIQALDRPGLEQNSLWLLDQVLPAFRSRYREFIPREWLDWCEAAAVAWPQLYGARVADRRSLTVVHGDCHWENVFLERLSLEEVKFVDWECHKRAIAAFDVAYLLFSGRSVAHRRRIEHAVICRYIVAAGRRGHRERDTEMFVADYRLAVVANLFVAVAWGRLQAFHDAIRAFVDWDCAGLFS